MVLAALVVGRVVAVAVQFVVIPHEFPTQRHKVALGVRCLVTRRVHAIAMHPVALVTSLLLLVR